MSKLRIVDAPLLPNVDGTEKIPTGGRGDYAISVDQIKGHIFQDVGKELVGLGNVDNTSDLDKPVSTAQQAALNLKADKTYVDTNLNLKADKTNVYTRTETTFALSKKADLVNGVVPESQIPSSFNDVLEFTTPNLPLVGESGKIYVTTDTNKTWRWATNKYVEISGWNPDSVSKSVTLPTYYTKESGVEPITGVADGAYFNVRSEGDETVAIEYQNVGGSAVATGKSYPSAAYVQKVAKHTALPFVDGKTYDSNERVVLENGDIVKSLFAGNTENPNENMAKWVNLTKTGRLIDTRLYGLKVNTELDQTAAIHAAFAANPDCSNFYIPKGTIKANIVYPRTFMNLVGDSMLSTTIQPFDLTKPAVSFGKRIYSALTQLSINAGQDFTAEHLLDATDTRYVYLREFDIKKTIKEGETHSYQTILIDQRPITTTWTGYNTLDTVRATLGAYGYLSDVEKLNSVLSMKSCVFAGNGYFGIKTNIENGSMLSMDVAGNGTLQPSGTYDESKYGGMYLSGENSVVLGCWSEYNADAGINFSANNIYFHPAKANNIVHNFGRHSRSSVGIKVFSRTQGQLINVSQADRATDDGLGRARPAQLLKNGNFKHFNSSSRPIGWSGSFNGTVTQETSDLPNGYNTGIKIISSAAGNTNCIQDIYNSTNIAGSLIKDISKWVGREVTFSFWLKNIGKVATGVRGGIATDVNAYFGDGNYFAASEVGQWRKFVCSRKITGTETRISFGFRVTGVGEGVIVTGASASDDCRVLDSQPKAITEDGGEIYGGLEVNGVISQNGDPLVGRPLQINTNGLQTATTPINTTGKYIGKFAWNTTDSKLYYATGATATSAWKSIDNLTTITPA